MSTKRQDILEALRARLQAITRIGGYATDAGALVFLGEQPDLGPDDPDVALAIGVGDDEPGHQGEHVFIRLPLEIQAIAKASLDEPWLTIEAVIGDIKKAVEQSDRTLGGYVKRQIERGVTRTLAREPGSTTVGVGITYVAPYVEVWGAP